MGTMFDIDGSVVVVTGASGGIGRGLAEYLLAAGATVAAVARNDQRAAELEHELGGHQRLSVHAADLRDTASIEPLFAEIETRHGRIDALVNVAGLGNPIPAIDVTPDDWDEMMDLNLRASFFCAQAAARRMLGQGHGRIVNMSSQISVVANRDEVVYCASKGGLNQVTKVLALEWGARGVVVTGVAPTFTYTPGTKERLDDPAFAASVLDRIPLGRFGTIGDIGAAVQYLLSDAGEMVNGHTLVIDGGWTIV